MKNIRKRIFACLLFAFSSSFLTIPLISFSQESQYTPYEAKVVDICTKYYAKVFCHKNASQLDMAESIAWAYLVSDNAEDPASLSAIIYVGWSAAEFRVRSPS